MNKMEDAEADEKDRGTFNGVHMLNGSVFNRGQTL